jgi:hypothetical protein
MKEAERRQRKGIEKEYKKRSKRYVVQSVPPFKKF